MRANSLLLACVLALAGCQKPDPLYCDKHPGLCDDAGNAIPDADLGVTIGGNVSGMAPAMGLLLENNGGDDLQIANDGAFVFETPVARGGAYDVMVATQPTMPSEMCTVTKGSGTANADVHDIQVTCMKQSYMVGGTVGGLNGGTQVALKADYGGATDNVTVTSNMAFNFPNPVQSGTNYIVSVTTQPASGGPCNVFGGTGTVGNSDVTSILVNCSATLFAIGGTVSGLNGTVKLTNTTNGNVATLSANGSYAFNMPVSGAYNVMVTQQPSSPVAQMCNVMNGNGTATTNVNNINVTCTTNKYTIGGTVSGLAGTLKLRDNGVDQLTLMTNGMFTFGTQVASGAGYNVTVFQNPSGQICTLANNAGMVTNANITNVTATCSASDPGIACGASYCTVGTQVCCGASGSSPNCQSSCSGSLSCDDAADCTGGKLCCISTSGSSGKLDGASCQSSCSSNNYLCDPNAATPCPNNRQCISNSSFNGYYHCN